MPWLDYCASQEAEDSHRKLKSYLNSIKTDNRRYSGLSIRFEVDGDILKVDGFGGRRPLHRRGVWGRLMPPVGYRGRAPLGVQGAKPP